MTDNGLIHIIIPKEPEDSDVVWHSIPFELRKLILRYTTNDFRPCNIIRNKKKKKKTKRKSGGRWVRVDTASKWTKVSMPTIYNWVRQGRIKKKGEFPMLVSYNDLRELIAQKRNGG